MAAESRSAHAPRQTLVDHATRELRERILLGRYPEGMPLRQDALAAELGVSRIPLREALRQLEAEGLVQSNPHRGAVVAVASLEEIGELFELRALIERDLLRRSVPRLSEAELGAAAATLDAFEEAFAARDVAGWGALNWRFHSTLLAAARRPRTLALLENLHVRSDRYMRMQLALTHGEGRASTEHRDLLAAARAGDAALAARLVSRHIRAAGRALIIFLRAHRAGPGRAIPTDFVPQAS